MGSPVLWRLSLLRASWIYRNWKGRWNLSSYIDPASIRCSNCFDAARTDAEAVKLCAHRSTSLPNFYSRCKEKVDSPTIPRYEVLQCFIDSIKLLDTNGEVKQGVQEFLGLKFAQTFSRLLIKRESTWKKITGLFGN